METIQIPEIGSLNLESARALNMKIAESFIGLEATLAVATEKEA